MKFIKNHVDLNLDGKYHIIIIIPVYNYHDRESGLSHFVVWVKIVRTMALFIIIDDSRLQRISKKQTNFLDKP